MNISENHKIDFSYTIGTGRNLVLLLVMQGETELIESVFRQVNEAVPGADMTLMVYESTDWDGDFSPWKYRMTDERAFAENGKETLEKIKVFIADVAQNYEHIFIAGYSLAGLFALWAVHETDIFDGCACCSGSLWFDGWEDYSETHTLKKPGIAYLSFGGKEDKAKDAIVATIGDKIRREDKRLGNDRFVKKHTLAMNPGGHFASPDKRLAQGIAWLMKEVL